MRYYTYREGAVRNAYFALLKCYYAIQKGVIAIETFWEAYLRIFALFRSFSVYAYSLRSKWKKTIALLSCLNFHLIGIKCLHCCSTIAPVYHIHHIYNEITTTISITFENSLFTIARTCNTSNGPSGCRFITDVFINIVWLVFMRD